jgi:hypothetical protein
VANKVLPVEAYPAEYLAFLRAAALGRVEVPAVTTRDSLTSLESGGIPRNSATNLIGKINALRGAMKKAGHPLYEAVAKASITKRLLSDGTAVIVGQPRDSDVLPHFHAAGFKPEVLPNDPLASPEFSGILPTEESD